MRGSLGENSQGRAGGVCGGLANDRSQTKKPRRKRIDAIPGFKTIQPKEKGKREEDLQQILNPEVLCLPSGSEVVGCRQLSALLDALHIASAMS